MKEIPRRSLVLHYLGRLFLGIRGWRVVGVAPPLRKYVILIAPHTSHWDTLYFTAAACAVRLMAHAMVKHTVFRGPVGAYLRWMGAIPVRRGEGQGEKLVDQAVAAFAERDYMVLVLAPEGTRDRRDYWRSGFYRIAMGAGVPVQLAYADFGKKEVGLGPLLELTGDADQDMAVIRAFYAGVQARHPERFSPVRFRE
ncbi:MAG: 1-acyl-sn-glycerol-3-phosphate acyltransferase [Candidatus Hydrogenedentes bacterium]|nr:1-acyl-sn-glycerol-3-phosphate acyltransferase [Candidatus Hydrogenedentota bacterium]